MDSLRRQVCSRTAALPPTLDEDAVADLEAGAQLPLKDAGPGYAALGSSGYADDTQAVALGAASLQGTVPMTAEVTGQVVRVDKSCSWVEGEEGPPAVLLRGVPIPLAETFRQLGVDVAIGGSRITGPVLSRRLEAGRSALRRLPHLSTYDRRERAISTLVTPLALHGVAVALVKDSNLRGLETAVVLALWGATCLSRAKEIVFSVRFQGTQHLPGDAHTVRTATVVGPCGPETGGHPGFHLGHLGVGRPPASGGHPPWTGTVGRVLQTAVTLGWSPHEG